MIKKDYTTPKQILFNVEHQVSTSCIVEDLVYVVEDGKKVVKAGTPMVASLTDRGVPTYTSVAAASAVAGVWELKIKTKFAADETLTIGEDTYTCKATENVGSKQFAGATAADQVTSLLKMVTLTGFTVAAVAGKADTIGFTQDTASKTLIPTASISAEATAVIELNKVVEPIPAADAVGVLLHDVDVTLGNANGALLIHGFVNLDRVDEATQLLITADVIADLAGRILFLR
jgi:hypothetical protein